MKKSVFFLITLCILCLSLTVPCYAQNKSYSWYCAHVKGHVQPKIGNDIAFVEELDGYYIDHTHTDPNDAEKVIYLTFDAGYENGNVAKILDILKDEQITAAFFILSNLVTRDTALVKRMTEEGHTVCNHTAHHKDLSNASDDAFLEELKNLEAVYRDRIGGEPAMYYRPPEGRFSRENLECAKRNGYKTVFWSFAYPDWDNEKQMSPKQAKQIILENIHNGEVMLLHPTSATNVAILGDVIRTLKADGYRFGTLDELTGFVDG